MDSMRSLNHSLPASTPLSTKPQSPEQLLQAFKSAALSVTNLYRSAAASQSDSRQQGYQDALEDLFVFLDKENLGLMDGEGWKVRQWATERFTRGSNGTNQSDNEEENIEDDVPARSSSPVRPQTQAPRPRSRTSSPARKEVAPAAPPPTTSETTVHLHQPSIAPVDPPMFTFTAAPPLDTPLDADMSATDQHTDSGEASVRLEGHNRAARSSHRHGGSSRNGQRSGPREVRLNSGSKRKFQVPDFFNLSNFDNNNGRDSSGGGSKRGRFA